MTLMSLTMLRGGLHFEHKILEAPFRNSLYQIIFLLIFVYHHSIVIQSLSFVLKGLLLLSNAYLILYRATLSLALLR